MRFSRTSSKNSFTRFSNQPCASPTAPKLTTEPVRVPNTKLYSLSQTSQLRFSVYHRTSSHFSLSPTYLINLTPPPSTHPILSTSVSLTTLNAIFSTLLSHVYTSSLKHVQLLQYQLSSSGFLDTKGSRVVRRLTKPLNMQPLNHATIHKSLLPSSSDLFSHIKTFIHRNWSTSWKNERIKGNKLAQLKDTPISWTSSNLQKTYKSNSLTLYNSKSILAFEAW